MIWFEELLDYTEIIRQFLDIIILSFLIYQIYKIFVKTRAIQLIKGAFLVTFIYAAAYFFKLTTLLWIMDRMAPVLVIIIAIIFQPELRSIFTRIGQRDWFRADSGAKPYHMDTVLNAIEVLSGHRRGALIVFTRKVGLKNIIDTGTKVNGDLSSRLLLTIFGFDTSLHDGAVIITAGKIISAGCFLPLSEQADIRRSFGTRHRAALGLAEQTDAVTVVVSEETGAVSLSYDTNLYYDLSIEEVRENLKLLLHVREDVELTEESFEE